MSDQFDLEQGIMNCWMITSDIDTLMEEVIEGDLTKDQISNVLMGLSQLYEIKFQKTFRIFEEFLKEYYRMRDEVNALKDQVEDLREALPTEQDLEDMRDDFRQSLADLFNEEEEQLRLMDENDRIDFIEDEFSEQ